MASIYDQFIGTVGQGVTNPYGLAAVAATGKHESGYSERNAYGQWSDPAESGSPGQAGGILSWRNERLANPPLTADTGRVLSSGGPGASPTSEQRGQHR